MLGSKWRACTLSRSVVGGYRQLCGEGLYVGQEMEEACMLSRSGVILTPTEENGRDGEVR